MGTGPLLWKHTEKGCGSLKMVICMPTFNMRGEAMRMHLDT